MCVVSGDKNMKKSIRFLVCEVLVALVEVSVRVMGYETVFRGKSTKSSSF